MLFQSCMTISSEIPQKKIRFCSMFLLLFFSQWSGNICGESVFYIFINDMVLICFVLVYWSWYIKLFKILQIILFP